MSARPVVVDSSGSIEMFTDGFHATSFVPVLDTEATLVVPESSILEVFKWVVREHSEAQAIQAVAAMQRGLWWISIARSRSLRPSSATSISCPWQAAHDGC